MSRWIVAPSRVDALTLLSLLLSAAGLAAAVEGRVSLGIALMILAMAVDMLDGPLARRWGMASDFGRELDSLCDVLTYLVLPLVLLHRLGLEGPAASAALFLFLACGVMRLARFNLEGTVDVGGAAHHRGLPVYCGPPAVALAFPAVATFGDRAVHAAAAVMAGLAGLMVADIQVRKPTAVRRLGLAMLLVAGLYLRLHLRGRLAP